MTAIPRVAFYISARAKLPSLRSLQLGSLISTRHYDTTDLPAQPQVINDPKSPDPVNNPPFEIRRIPGQPRVIKDAATKSPEPLTIPPFQIRRLPTGQPPQVIKDDAAAKSPDPANPPLEEAPGPPRFRRVWMWTKGSKDKIPEEHKSAIRFFIFKGGDESAHRLAAGKIARIYSAIFLIKKPAVFERNLAEDHNLASKTTIKQLVNQTRGNLLFLRDPGRLPSAKKPEAKPVPSDLARSVGALEVLKRAVEAKKHPTCVVVAGTREGVDLMFERHLNKFPGHFKKLLEVIDFDNPEIVQDKIEEMAQVLLGPNRMFSMLALLREGEDGVELPKLVTVVPLEEKKI